MFKIHFSWCFFRFQDPKSWIGHSVVGTKDAAGEQSHAERGVRLQAGPREPLQEKQRHNAVITVHLSTAGNGVYPKREDL